MRARLGSHNIAWLIYDAADMSLSGDMPRLTAIKLAQLKTKPR